ncbi:hypothetical protein BC629DRAFT_628876 [Irpex lacteus]|nr:hypothetical protein BC629DRAFT_628876 [Irpex lacteus]
MDSEDERELSDGAQYGLGCESNLWDPSYVCIRVWEDYERHYLRTNCLRIATLGAQADKLVEIRTKARFERFWRSVIGFHCGSLDLKGRHEHRYKSLMNKWHAITAELDNIERVAADFISKSLRKDALLAAYRFADAPDIVTSEIVRVCAEFHEKWRITNTPTDVLLVCQDAKQKCREELRRNPSPKFQRLLLRHLPVEIIYNIMKLVGPRDAHRLASCSKTFHEVFISKPNLSIRIDIPYSKTLLMARVIGEQPTREGLQALAKDVVTQATRRIESLISQPQHLNGVRKLTVHNDWSPRRLLKAGWRYNQQILYFLGPLSHSIIEFLSSAVNLQTLCLHGVTINTSIVEGISTGRKLSYLILDDCFIPPLVEDVTGPCRSTSLVHLTVTHGPKYANDIWKVIKCIPRLRWLEVDGSRSPGSLLFPHDRQREEESDFHALSRSFLTVERAYFRSLAPCDVDDLITMLEYTRSIDDSPPFQFTHFKLEVHNAMPHEYLVRLLEALSSAPLRHLVIEGLARVDKRLFHFISSLFPKLVSLVIVHRASERQSVTKGTEWGTQLSDIGPGFAGFKNLEYFGCNMKLTIDPSPSAAIVAFENDFDEDSKAAQDVYFDAHDWKYAPRVFAAYCPTLHTVSFIQHGPIGHSVNFGILRSATGHATCEHMFEKGNLEKLIVQASYPLQNPYNPDMINYSWPMFSS